MLTRPALEQTFKVYFDEMKRCIDGKCYWALLHIVLVLPDVCAAMETDNGDAATPKYLNWCKRYLADKKIKAEDWYRMRCVILHQGRTLDKKCKYSAFSFSQPNEDGSIVHRCVKEDPQGKILELDVGKMADEVCAAINKWFDYIEKNENPPVVENIARNSGLLVRSHDTSAMPIAIQVCTTSSPRPTP